MSFQWQTVAVEGYCSSVTRRLLVGHWARANGSFTTTRKLLEKILRDRKSISMYIQWYTRFWTHFSLVFFVFSYKSLCRYCLWKTQKLYWCEYDVPPLFIILCLTVFKMLGLDISFENVSYNMYYKIWSMKSFLERGDECVGMQLWVDTRYWGKGRGVVEFRTNI